MILEIRTEGASVQHKCIIPLFSGSKRKPRLGSSRKEDLTWAQKKIFRL